MADGILVTSLVSFVANLFSMKSCPSHLRAFSLYGILVLSATASQPTLQDEIVCFRWKETNAGWQMESVGVKSADSSVLSIGRPSGAYTVLYSKEKPDARPVRMNWGPSGGIFPERSYRYLIDRWDQVTTPAALNRAGEAMVFFPSKVEATGQGWRFSHEEERARVSATWSLHPEHPGDVLVKLELTARKAGWFSLATPTLTELPEQELAWGIIPGVFQGARINPDFILASAYGLGLPNQPILARDRVATTHAAILTAKSGATLGVIAEPGTGNDPWPEDRHERTRWRLAMSHMNRAGVLAPTLYHPVLGEAESHMDVGEHRVLRFRYTLKQGDWIDIVRHAAYSIYDFDAYLKLKRPERSMSERLAMMHRYLTDAKTSLWRTEHFGGLEIGAQAYLGGVMGAIDRDAMKNSDYGAMWMLAHQTHDPKLVRDRLPFARNFKLVQQQVAPGFFQGAALGQYYLSKSHRFTEEWGDHVEPVSLTYYTMIDIGNILLFEPGDRQLRERLRLGAECLLRWQRADGSWEVAYDRATEKPIFRELKDLRPTFYGLLIAYRILGDEKYLAAARRGADWLITHGVDTGEFLGVCGDTRLVQDFATSQIAQAYLDLFEATGDSRYREAGIRTGRHYLWAIYTHPAPSRELRRVKDHAREAWQISWQGLGFEHGTALGSANASGPILLASHAGLFVRLHAMTGDSLFLDYARGAAWARDAFVDPKTGVASYYWARMNDGPGPYPHHAWWQVGWITDYLISEATLRSKGKIAFPRGFFTPKVGPHACYGFAPGKVFGAPADLGWAELPTQNAAIDTLIARSDQERKVFVLLLNNSTYAATASIELSAVQLAQGEATQWNSVRVLNDEGIPLPTTTPAGDKVTARVPAAGLLVLELSY